MFIDMKFLRCSIQPLFTSVLIVLISLFVYSSCTIDDDDDVKNDKRYSRTVLLYMVAENSLDYFVADDINEALRGAGSMTDDDVLVVFVDDVNKPRIYEINNKTDVSNFYELRPTYEFDKDVNSASAEMLREVLTYMNKKYPTDSSGIIFWSHASGWVPSPDMYFSAPLRKSFGVDNGKNTNINRGSEMNIADMAKVLEDFGKFEFLMFDACFMQCIEVAYELRNSTNYIIASPAEIPGLGAEYGSLLRPIFSNIINPSDIVDAYYRYYENNRDYGIVLSVIDCNEIEEFAALMADVISKYAGDIIEMDVEEVQKYFNYDEWKMMSNYPDFHDIRGLMLKLLTPDEYARWNESFMRLVPCAKSTDAWFSEYCYGFLDVDKNQYGGVTMFLPLKKYAREKFYNYFYTTSWAHAVGFYAPEM